MCSDKMCVWKYLTVFILASLVVENKGASLRLVGGYNAPADFGRFQASLQNVAGNHVCGGALVGPSHVVTAAHCVEDVDPLYVNMVVGTTNLDNRAQAFRVMSIYVHEDYNSTNRNDDIAVIVVAGEFREHNTEILEIDGQELVEGDPVILSGFGALIPHDASNRILYALNLTVFSQATCKYAMRYTREIVSSMFCTFSQIGQGTCHGDSGGPIIKNNKLVGLVSWGIPCAVGFPDVHTRISPYVEWINSIIAISEED